MSPAILDVTKLTSTLESSYGYGWNVMKKYVLEFFLVTIVAFAFSLPTIWINAATEIHHPMVIMLKMFVLVYGIFILGPIEYGIRYVYLQASMDKPFKVKEMFGVFENYLNVILANLLVAAIVIFGFFLLIVPGIIFACKLAFVPYLVTAEKLDPVEAVKRSWHMTHGHGWTIFLMAIVSFFIYIAGLICLIVGVIFASMWVRAAFASLYYSVSRNYVPPDNGETSVAKQG